jgi:DNA polymerase-3 subunit delta
MSPIEFLKEVRKGKRFDVVVLAGSEEFLLRQALREYLEQIVTPDAAAFDYTEFRGTDMERGVLWNALTTLPLMSDRRVVLWEISGEVKADVLEAFSRYVQRPSPKTSLVIDLSGANRDVRLANALSSPNVTVIEFRDLKENDRSAWVEKYVRDQGKSIDADALRYVVETSTKSIADLAAKLGHAVLYIGEAKEITVQVLMRISGVSSEYTVYNLEDALMAQKPVQAHRIARELLEGGEALLRLIAFHRGMVLKLWQVKSTFKKSSSWERSVEAGRIYETIFGRQIFKKDAYKRVARQFEEQSLRDAIIRLVQVEVHAKSESQDPYYYYEWLWRFASVSPVFFGTRFLDQALTG